MGFRNWYEETIVSRIVSCGCGMEEIDELRKKVVPLASGKVFELGCGGGFNQQHYDNAKVTGFAGIDPNGALLEGARARAVEKGWEADIRAGYGEDIPFEDSSFDTVLCTFTLCSVDDEAKVLSEMRRILRPGGQLLFLEHGKAPDPGPQKWQRRIEPVWKRLMGNCHLTRPVIANVEGGGFAIEDSGKGYQEKGPKWVGWMEWGVARKAGA